MKLIMLSTDENIFKEGSEARSRMIEYGKLVEELHIIVLMAQNFKFQISNFETPMTLSSRIRDSSAVGTNSKSQISKNTFVYPAFSVFESLCLVKAYKISSSIIKNLKFEIKNCVVTTQDPFEIGLIGYFLKRKFSAQGGSASGGNVPLQIQIHTDFLSPYFWRESVANKIRVLIAKKIIPSADGLRVVSDRIKKSVITQLPNYPITRIAVLPIFIDVGKIINSPIKTDLRQKYPGKFIVLMASRFTREKNINLAIRAVKNLIPNYPNLLLLIVGSGPELRNLKLQVTSYKLQDFVVFEPWSDDLASYYKTADLFLLASNYEGYGRTVVEAATAGLPVVMTDAGVAIGSVVPVGDVKKLTENLDVLIRDSSERRKILESQNKILENMPSKQEYYELIKQLWSRCFSVKNTRFQSESGENI